MQLLPRPSSRAISTATGRPAGSDAAGHPGVPVAVHRHHQHADAADRPRLHPDAQQHDRRAVPGGGSHQGRSGRYRVWSGRRRERRRSSCSRWKPRSSARSRSHPGDVVHAGQILARLDPTFATADMGALVAQVSTLQAQVSRMQAEMENRPFTYSGLDPNMALQAAIHGQRLAEYDFKLENYQQKADSLSATIARARADIASYSDRLTYARSLESMRKELEHLNVGSKINTLSAMDTRAQMQGSLDSAMQQAAGAQRDLAALIAETQRLHPDLACRHCGQADRCARQTVRCPGIAEQGAIAPATGRTARGTGRHGADVSARCRWDPCSTPGSSSSLWCRPTRRWKSRPISPAADDGHVHVGDPVDIKFDTFPYTQYGMAHGLVRIVSPDSFSAQDEQRNPTGAVPVSQQNNGVWFRSRITLDQINLHGTPANFHLVPGMPIMADIRVGQADRASLHAGEDGPAGHRRACGSRKAPAPERNTI